MQMRKASHICKLKNFVQYIPYETHGSNSLPPEVIVATANLECFIVHPHLSNAAKTAGIPRGTTRGFLPLAAPLRDRLPAAVAVAAPGRARTAPGRGLQWFAPHNLAFTFCVFCSAIIIFHVFFSLLIILALDIFYLHFFQPIFSQSLSDFIFLIYFPIFSKNFEIRSRPLPHFLQYKFFPQKILLSPAFGQIRVIYLLAAQEILQGGMVLLFRKQMA